MSQGVRLRHKGSGLARPVLVLAETSKHKCQWIGIYSIGFVRNRMFLTFSIVFILPPNKQLQTIRNRPMRSEESIKTKNSKNVTRCTHRNVYRYGTKSHTIAYSVRDFRRTISRYAREHLKSANFVSALTNKLNWKYNSKNYIRDKSQNGYVSRTSAYFELYIRDSEQFVAWRFYHCVNWVHLTHPLSRKDAQYIFKFLSRTKFERITRVWKPYSVCCRGSKRAKREITTNANTKFKQWRTLRSSSTYSVRLPSGCCRVLSHHILRHNLASHSTRRRV